MPGRSFRVVAGVSGVVLVCGLASAVAAEMPSAEAWQALPRYTAGQDLAPLLTIDREAIAAMATPQAQAAFAAKLAALLDAADATPATRQYVCRQLRQVGTAAEVPRLVSCLNAPEVADAARQALEAIPGPEATAALRQALETLRGPLLVGAIRALGTRRDTASQGRLQELAGATDAAVVAAAMDALSDLNTPPAATFLAAQVQKAAGPLPLHAYAVCLQAAQTLAQAGQPAEARAAYSWVAQQTRFAGARRAALEGLLSLEPDRAATVLAWFSAADAVRRQVAAGHLGLLSSVQRAALLEKFADLPEAGQVALLEVMAPQGGAAVAKLVSAAAGSQSPGLRLAGIRGMGVLGDAAQLPFLIECLAAGPSEAAAAQDALCRLPRKAVGEAMIGLLAGPPEPRAAAIEVLRRLRYYEAIDPLVALAAHDDPSVYTPALEGLRGIADPDKTDLARLVTLLLKTAPGPQRTAIEQTIVLVCDKLPPAADRGGVVLAAMTKAAAADVPGYLPLIGRLGGARAVALVESSLKSPDTEIRQAAQTALCRWPNADVAPQLWTLATTADDAGARQTALRAYVRVVTLKSDRPEAQTLAMLQQAFQKAAHPNDRRLIVTRAANVRTLETVTWIATFLDDPELAQAACASIVELAHHRFLRHPNMDQFGPLLDRIGGLSTDPAIVERAKKYRLGL